MALPAAWTGARDLDVLRGSPVNCLLLPESSPLADPARDRGITVVTDPKAHGIALAGDSVWPGVQAPDKTGAAATGLPWIDANSWYVDRERARGVDGPIWLMHTPPANPAPEAYLLAVADAESSGGRWVIRVQPGAPLPRILQALRFFGVHREWRTWRPEANVLVVSDFAGSNEHLGGEILNLAARRLLSYRVATPSSLRAINLTGIRCIIAMDGGTPDPAASDALLHFAASGGLLLTGSQWKIAGQSVEPHPRFRIVRHGRGRVAVCTEESPDPYNVAGDAHILLSHAHDLFRLHNPGSILVRYSMSADGKRDLLQLISYATRRTMPVTVWMRRAARKTRLWTIDSEVSQELASHKEGGGYEFHVGSFATYAALERELG